MKQKKFTAVLPILSLLLLTQCKPVNKEYTHLEGNVFGTYYHITYLHPKGKNLAKEVEDKFKVFDLSLSTYNPNSIISRINKNDTTVTTDRYFEEMYDMARQVSEKSGGAFDITVAPLVGAWGFGYGSHDQNSQPSVDTILPYIGFHKVKLLNHKLVKADRRIRLDASAIAKGQGSDVIAQLLREQGCENYMVEIGGEVTCRGLNPKGEKWHIGIDKPNDDPADENKELQTIIAITDAGMATSGNYRQYYFRNGKKYAHTINPHTGYPVQHNLLSATVIAPTCMQADAYATAFMVVGVDSSLQICSTVPDMDCYLIYTNEKGEYKTAQTAGFEKYLTK